MLRLVLLFLIIPTVCFAQNHCQEKLLYGTVSRVADGDTLTIKQEKTNNQIKIRFVGIDTAETSYMGKNQGEVAFEASNYMKQLAPIGTQVKVLSDNVPCDKYKRYLGNIFKKVNGKYSFSLNYEMLRKGYAVAYQIWPNYDKEIPSIAKQAEDLGIGIYNPINMIPYEWRRLVSKRDFTYITVDITRECYVMPDRYSDIAVSNRLFFNKIDDLPNYYRTECN